MTTSLSLNKLGTCWHGLKVNKTVICSRAVLSNLFGTAGRIRINLEAAGLNSKQRLKFTEHY